MAASVAQSMRSSLSRTVFPLAAAALTTLHLTGGLAQAAVIHVDRSASPLVIPNTIDGLYLNVITGVTSTSSSPAAGWDFNPYNNGSGLGFFAPDFPSSQGTLASGATALALLGGETIGSGGIYQPGQALGTNFRITGTGFAGLRFQNEVTGQLNYGWVRLSTTAGTGFPASILAYAYEDSGAPILAGQVPEPTGPGLLALSAALAGHRRRRCSRAHSKPL